MSEKNGMWFAFALNLMVAALFVVLIIPSGKAPVGCIPNALLSLVFLWRALALSSNTSRQATLAAADKVSLKAVDG